MKEKSYQPRVRGNIYNEKINKNIKYNKKNEELKHTLITIVNICKVQM